MKQKFFLLAIFQCATGALGAQTFTDLHSGLPTLSNGAVAWADCDLDGDSDLALMGFSNTGAITSVYKNDGHGNLQPLTMKFINAADGAINWGDYDNDHDPDLLISGTGKNSQPVSVIYRNDGNNQFIKIKSGIKQVYGIARWIDYDSDGFLDVITAGFTNNGIKDSVRLYRNNHHGKFKQVKTNIPDFTQVVDIACADFDRDGKTDFFIIGKNEQNFQPRSALFKNTGGGNFKQVNSPFLNLWAGQAAWGDYNNDGFLDIAYDGVDSTFSFSHTYLYKNNGNGKFSRINANLPGSGEPGALAWGDVDNDHDLDLIIAETPNGTRLMRNDGNNAFTDISDPAFGTGYPPSFADVDNDHDLDILLVRQDQGFTATTIFRNDLMDLSRETGNVFSKVSIIPNPASDYLFAEIDDAAGMSNTTIQLMNQLGELVYESSINPGERKSIYVGHLSPGMYYVHFISAEKIITQKIIVE